MSQSETKPSPLPSPFRKGRGGIAGSWLAMRWFTLSRLDSGGDGFLGGGGRGFGLRFGFAFADPTFNAELAIDGVRFGETVVDVRAQGVQRNAAPMVLLDAGQFGAAETAGATNLDAFSTEVLGGLERFLHRAAE